MKWTQDESIAFESARECITALMSIQSEMLSIAEAKGPAGEADALRWRAKLSGLAKERASLQVKDDATISRVRREYGVLVRADSERRRGLAPKTGGVRRLNPVRPRGR